MEVVTYEMDGETVNICPRHKTILLRERRWPISSLGTDLANVQYGLHRGRCDYCEEA